jgi:circadian clock protein KaiB
MVAGLRIRSEQWLFRLYVTGDGGLSRNARGNLERLCREYLKDAYRIEVVDLLKQPGLAREHGLIATLKLYI